MTQLERFKKAISRLDYFGAPADTSSLFVDYGNTLYELLDRSEADRDDLADAQRLTLGDLRELIKELG